ncbi:MAG: helix-turn-helix transcriptional regulator [Candidatus Doudnabacteria bacterium]|nr:helix-turn-helix transcriptional regulator [Candidatus Doudnabacteria bacterium]
MSTYIEITYKQGSILRILRKQRGISQLNLEAQAQLSPGSISRIENNKTNPTKETLFKLAIILQLSREEIVDLFAINELLKIQPTH